MTDKPHWTDRLFAPFFAILCLVIVAMFATKGLQQMCMDLAPYQEVSVCQ